MTIVDWPISKLKVYPRNARKITDKAVDKVAISIKEFGWRQPIVVDTDGVIVIGHVRRLAAMKLGLLHVPVHIADNLTPAQIKALRLMDNRSHDDVQWDEDLLGPELCELKLLDIDLNLTGFDTREIDALLANPDDDDKANECPEVPVAPVSRAGDLWLCGPHRVLCGDSTDAVAVATLLGGKKAPFLMVTDPPYGVDYDPTWRDGVGAFGTPGKGNSNVIQRGKVQNDDRSDWAAAYEHFPGSVVYAWHASLKTIETGVSLLAAGFEVRACIIWRKQQALFGQGTLSLAA